MLGESFYTHVIDTPNLRKIPVKPLLHYKLSVHVLSKQNNGHYVN